MHTARLPTVHVSVATKCQHGEGRRQVIKFEQVSSFGYQMSLAGTRGQGSMCSEVQCLGDLGPGKGFLYVEV